MFKIFVMMTSSGSFDGGRAMATETIEFNTKVEADVAAEQLNRGLSSDARIVKLYK